MPTNKKKKKKQNSYKEAASRANQTTAARSTRKPPPPPLSSKALRFVPGDNVTFLTNEEGWQSGTVEETMYRTSKQPKSKPPYAYRVERKSCLNGNRTVMINIEFDTDDFIQVLQKNQRPIPTISLLEIDPPEPEDPMECLYHDIKSKNEVLKHLENAEKFSGGGILAMYKTLANGDSLLCKASDVDLPNPETFFVSKAWNMNCPLVYGVEAGVAKNYIAPRIWLRSKFNQKKVSVEETIKLILPDHPTMARHEYAMQRASIEERGKLLLQLGDALWFGLMGWKRNPYRTEECYNACAKGLGLDNPLTTRSVVMGPPESSSALAVFGHFQAEMLAFASKNNKSISECAGAGMDRPMLELHEIFTESLRSEKLRSILSDVVVSFLYLSLRSGWVSNLAIQYGAYFEKNQRMAKQTWMKELEIDAIQDAYTNTQLSAQARKGMRKVPGEETLKLFGSKCLEILKEIPRADDLIVHIRFTEIPDLSGLLGVVLVTQGAGTFADDLFLLPEALQLFPFSDEAFEWIWNRVGFHIHLGISGSHHSRSRLRPSRIELVDRPGDRHLANFLKRKFQSTAGTTVSVISADIDLSVEMEDRIWCKEKQLVESHKDKFRLSPFGTLWQRTMIFEGIPSSPSTQTMNDQLESDVEGLRRLGEAYFAQEKFSQAKSMATRAISKLRRSSRRPSIQFLKLAGKLLSNLAASNISMARTVDANFGLLLLREAIACCVIFLSSNSICSASSDALLNTVKFQRDIANSRTPLYSNLVFHTDYLRSDRFALHIHLNFNLRLFNDDAKPEKNERVKILTGQDMRGKTDEVECPICLGRFDLELSTCNVLRFACGHLCCVSCAMRSRDKESDKFSCSLCREKFQEDILSYLVDHTIMSCIELKKLTEQLPGTEDERQFVVEQILKLKEMDAAEASKYIDDMLWHDAIGWNSRRPDDLSHQEKDKLFEEAQRPVRLIDEKIHKLRKERDAMLDRADESERFIEISKDIQDLQSKRHRAAQNARDDIFSQMNSQGKMGAMDEQGGYIVDFHGLRANDAKYKFDEEIMPVLPVLGRCDLIVGKGSHSPGGKSVLRHAISKHVATEYGDKVIIEDNAANRGIITVRHTNSV